MSKFNIQMHQQPSKTEITVQPASHDEGGGSRLLGHISATYQEIVAVLGKPNAEGDDDQVHNEWRIKFVEPDGKAPFASIYDWKSGNRSRSGVYLWHIGGYSSSAVKLVQDLLSNL